MEFHASKDFAMMAIDKQKNYKVFIIINFLAAFTAIFIALSGYYPITTVIVVLITLYEAYLGYTKNKYYDSQITDISEGYIRFEDDVIYCRQAAENYTYEECEIDIHEVESILEDTKPDKCGFYIKLQDDYSLSHIFVNDKITERNLFYVSGINYDRTDFKKYYEEIRNNVPLETNIVGTEKQSSWDVISEKNEFLKLISPVIFLYIVTIVHLFLFMEHYTS